MNDQMRLSEKAMYCTVKLTCEFEVENEQKFCSGTGFIFKFFRNVKDSYPVIITNKHVVQNALRIIFYLNRSTSDNFPLHGDPIEIPLGKNAQKQILYHPDRSIDIAILPIGGIIQYLLDNGDRPYYTGIDSTTIPNNEQWNKFHALEDVLVVGYPNNLEDDINKLPIFIKGNTATYPLINFQNKEEFLINANVYPGSSGSPVFLLDDNFYAKSRKYKSGRDKVKLMGVLFSGYNSPVYEYSNSREPIKTKYFNPMNICRIIRSSKLLDFESLMEQEIRKIEHEPIK